MDEPPKQPASYSSGIALVAKFTGLGWIIAVELLGPAFLGVWLDNMWDMRPLFMLIGLGIGTLLVPYTVWKYVKLVFKVP